MSHCILRTAHPGPHLFAQGDAPWWTCGAIQPAQPEPELSDCCNAPLRAHWPCDEFNAECSQCGECKHCGSSYEPSYNELKWQEQRERKRR